MTILGQINAPRTQFLDTTGALLVGGTVATYIPGTTTGVSTWQDPNGDTMNSNPITLDDLGSCSIYYNGLVRLIIEDADGNQVYDQVTGSGPTLSIGTFALASTTFIPVGTDIVQSSGYYTVGDGGHALYVYSSAVDAAYVAANPLISFISANGRGFTLAIQDWVNSRWFGALGGPQALASDPVNYIELPDDTVALQAAIDYCIANLYPLFTPSAGYKITSPLHVWNRNATTGVFNPCGLVWAGGGSNAANIHAANTVITCTQTDTFCVGVQYIRGLFVRNISFVGRNTLPANWNSPTSNVLEQNTFINNGVRDSKYSPYSGWAIDPFGPMLPTDGGYPGYSSYYVASASFSAFMVFDNVSVTNFTACWTLDPSGQGSNTSETQWNHCAAGDAKVCIVTTQPEERNMHWFGGTLSNCYYIVDGLNYGAGDGASPHIYGANTGFFAYFFTVSNVTGEAPVKLHSVHMESCGALGFIGTAYTSSRFPAEFVDCEIKLGFADTTVTPDLHLVTYSPVLFQTCDFGVSGVQGSANVAYPVRIWADNVATIRFSNCVLPGNWNYNQPQGSEFGLCPTSNAGNQYKFEDCIVGSTGIAPSNICKISTSVIFTGTSDANQTYMTNGQYVQVTSQNAVQVVASSVQETVIGNCSVVVNANKTATITVPDTTIFKIQDTILNNSTFSYENYNGTTTLALVGVGLGTVTAIGTGTITVDGIPENMVSGTYSIALQWWSKYHQATTGSLTSGSTTITGVSAIGAWAVNNRFNLNIAGIPHGAYITAVDAGTSTITVSKAATATATGIRLYDADLRAIATTPV